MTAVGAISMLAGFGEVALLGHVLPLDPVGVALGTMTGLALGCRVRAADPRPLPPRGAPPGAASADAATAALRELETTGRAVLVGGTALVLALAIVAVIGPTQLMVSLGTGMLDLRRVRDRRRRRGHAGRAGAAGPPDRRLQLPRAGTLWRVPGRALVDGGNRVTRHAVYAGFAATALLAAIAVPAFALNSGPPDMTQLPVNAQARIAFEEVSRVMGPGWATPYNLIVVANGRPLTTPALLGEHLPVPAPDRQGQTVDSVTGPGAINSTSTQLQDVRPAAQALRHGL